MAFVWDASVSVEVKVHLLGQHLLVQVSAGLETLLGAVIRPGMRICAEFIDRGPESRGSIIRGRLMSSSVIIPMRQKQQGKILGTDGRIIRECLRSDFGFLD
jgi:hypothetical protein